MSRDGKIQHIQLGLLAGIALAGIAFGAGVERLFLPHQSHVHFTDDCNKKYSLLRSDLDCTTANDDYERVQKIQEDLNAYVDEQKIAGNISRASIYFRDLSSRRWASIEKKAQYAPGSLLKTPLAIAYYKLSEIEPQILSEEYTYSPTSENTNDLENYKPADQLVAGQKYTVDELIGRMIMYSDNEATVLLNTSIDQTFLRKVLSDLGIHLPTTGGSEQNFITTESYSAILRSLYLSSYLNIDNSQKLLTLLSQTSFSQGIASGVPHNINIAHKFGERKSIDQNDSSKISAELHDCGIVYSPEKPYILCVMTEGTSYDYLPEVLSKISKIVYEANK